MPGSTFFQDIILHIVTINGKPDINIPFFPSMEIVNCTHRDMFIFSS